MKLILTLEPEMVKNNTQLDRDHPEWILRLGDSWAALLNLGDPAAREWLTRRVSSIIAAEDVKVFRQQVDYYIDYTQFWRQADEPDREGITEIRWVEGLYAFWDDLRRSHPGLLIDDCTFGDRRLDLERTSRAINTLRSIDPYGQPHIRVPEARPDSYFGSTCHAHTYALNLWLPFTSSACNEPTDYEFHGALGAGMLLRWDPDRPTFPAEAARRLVEQFRQVRHFFYGDFYPLTPYSIRDDAWMAYQLHRDDLEAGLVLAFRRPHSFQSSARVSLAALGCDTSYALTYHGDGRRLVATGSELADGLLVELPNPASSLLLTYREAG
jgi:alpha-galactosidase